MLTNTQIQYMIIDHQQRKSACLPYSSIDNFFSPILVSGWLIFHCADLILHQKRNENVKKTNFLMKSKKKLKKNRLKR